MANKIWQYVNIMLNSVFYCPQCLLSHSLCFWTKRMLTHSLMKHLARCSQAYRDLLLSIKRGMKTHGDLHKNILPWQGYSKIDVHSEGTSTNSASSILVVWSYAYYWWADLISIVLNLPFLTSVYFPNFDSSPVSLFNFIMSW